MGSVPGDSDFQSDLSDPSQQPTRGSTRQDLGFVPTTKPQFGSLSNIGSEPGFVPKPGPLGSVGQDLGSVPKLGTELGSVLSSGRRLTVPVSYDDSGVESSEFQDISMAMQNRQIGDIKDSKSVSASDSIPELEEALSNLSQESVEEKRKRMFRLEIFCCDFIKKVNVF